MKDWKNTLKRALKTFVQAALAYAAANIAGIVGEGTGITQRALTTLFVSSVAAGLAALMNLPDHAGKADGVEYVEGPAVTKRIDESIDDIPMAGQTSVNMDGADAQAAESAQASQSILTARANEETADECMTPVQAGQDEPDEELPGEGSGEGGDGNG